MDRTAFKIPFTKDRVPTWPCPRCGAGQLQLLPQSLVKQETPDSRDHSHEEWEPYWIRYVYACVFVCSNGVCREMIGSSGIGRVDYNEYEDEEHGRVQAIEDLFTPKFFEPSLRLIDLPLNCPFEVAGHLQESFALFFAAPGAALNCVRTAVESVLTDLDVKRFTAVKGERRPISLHQRISLLPPKLHHLAEMLTAIKWLGNAGSHAGSDVSADDVLVAYNLVEHVLAEIYDAKGKKLTAIAKKVNKKKGLVKAIAKG